MTRAWAVLPSARRWSVGALRDHFAGASRPCNVLKARSDVAKYTYYFKDYPDRDVPAEAKEAQPVNSELAMSFEEFLRVSRDDPLHSYYLQTPLFSRDPRQASAGDSGDGNGSSGASDSLKAEVDKAMAGEFWRELHAALGNTSWLRTQLFVGPVGTLGSCHYDQFDNIFLQVRGSKRILLIDPRSGCRGLYPFPVHHPYDLRARLDLETPDYTACDTGWLAKARKLRHMQASRLPRRQP
eukprot:NODE_8450_length_1495_cov_3.961257.p1 GENE.NODE_8450_length_1495_cov_3.961257~~NODE_8450_length_1495_cov_3.961257.p1  ORF type:complete len:258 (-),score=67.50 NODE_8450_length_1495_cov_3.961257:722-1441(-)